MPDPDDTSTGVPPEVQQEFQRALDQWEADFKRAVKQHLRELGEQKTGAPKDAR